MKGSWGVHWFRRDLRVFGNDALQLNLKKNEGKVLGLFCFDAKFLERPDFSNNRFAFFIKTLVALRKELHHHGGDLLVIDSSPELAFSRLLDFFQSHEMGKPALVTWGRDYEPFARNRDAKVAQLLEKEGVDYVTARDHVLLEPNEILKDDEKGGFYQVYSPFFKKWLSRFHTDSIQDRIGSQKKIKDYANGLLNGEKKEIFKISWKPLLNQKDFPFDDACSRFEKTNSEKVVIPIPEAGFSAAFQKLEEFKSGLAAYLDKRDIPSLSGTSRLSIFLKNGSIATSQVISYLGLNQVTDVRQDGPLQFLKEIAWREFYYSILFHRPDVEHTSFLLRYADIKWENNSDWFERWKIGMTGVPIVDAGMRELLHTGWMHNRVRMIVASFLTKDLLIDWRWGEKHFMHHLLDGDLASNNGGWQWAASTGCDPQPYFRIFNPWLQSEKFDPNGDYIKRFIPELAFAHPKILHQEDADRSRFKYPTPLVRHASQREKALKLYHSQK